MKHRLFIAINLPENIKRRITQIITQINAEVFQCLSASGPRESAASPRQSAFRWLTPENWHLTVSFLGYQPEEDLKKITAAVKETASSFRRPLVETEKIVYGPTGRQPRMVWLIIKPSSSQSLEKIKIFLEDELERKNIRWQGEKRRFSGHLTLARFDQTIVLKRLPPLDEKFHYQFQAESFDLMESILKREGASYNLLERFNFNEK